MIGTTTSRTLIVSLIAMGAVVGAGLTYTIVKWPAAAMPGAIGTPCRASTCLASNS